MAMRRSYLLAVPLLASAIAIGSVACDDSSVGGSGGDGGAPDSASTTDSGPGPDAGTDSAIANECTTPTGGPTEHGTNIANETWTAAASPHIVRFDSAVTGTLTIEPCAEVLIAPNITLQVVSTGKLVAEGKASKRIHVGAVDSSKPFLRIQAGGGGTMRFAYATIDGGGDPSNALLYGTGMLFAQGVDQTMPTQPTLFVDHVSVLGSKSSGVVLIDGAGFAAGSQDLTISGAKSFPLSVWSRAIGTVPSGTYTGNAIDEIMIPGGGGAEAVHEDATMRNRGVPYRIGNDSTFGYFTIERQAPSTPGLATLTIEAGVKLRVKKGGLVQVQRFTGDSPAQGALIVNGTAAEPVVFTSAEASPAPGDWLGIWFGMVPAPSNKIDHARVEYAGGETGSGSAACNTPGSNTAGIRIYGLPSGAFVTNTTIAFSGGHGIDRGWRNDAKPDFLPTNTFTNIARCRQSYPSDTTGACPDPVPCP